MRKLSIQSGTKTYPVCIESGIIGSGDLSTLPNDLLYGGQNIVLIVDENLEGTSTHAKKFIGLLSKKYGTDSVLKLTLKSGENSKSINKVYPFFQELIKFGATRHTPIIAMGGGVCGDAAGFLASIFLRGVPFIQIPTTLLSMVDSSIGGKVAINHELGKNLIGSFYPPDLVIIDPDFLNSLPERDYCSGLAECVKHALIDQEGLLEWMEKNRQAIKERDKNTLLDLIEKNLLVKKTIVERDEHESGDRAFLNLGHTFAHAIEKEFSFSNHNTLQGYLHGEAVSIGLMAAAHLSTTLHEFPETLVSRLSDLLSFFKLPIKLTEDSSRIDKLLAHMEHDKKKISSQLTLILLNQDKKPILNSKTSAKERRMAWESVLEQ